VTSLDAGMSRTYWITGLAWDDENGDGIQSEEGTLSEVLVRLLDSNGTEIDTTYTDEIGQYAFADLPSGDYFIEFASPINHAFSPQNQGSDPLYDSDPDPVTGRTSLVSLESGEDAYFIDAGFVFQLATISGRAWADTTEDGIQDEIEDGFANVTVNLMDSTGTSLFPSATTDVNGDYIFENVAAGNYRITFVAPISHVFSPQDQGGDETDSDADFLSGQTAQLSVAWNQDAEHVDAGII
jgi:serine-aspartate repeat-containing protein C/D/E